MSEQNRQDTEPAIGGLGVAVIGCGYWGVNYVRILKELLEVETVVACDARPTRLKKVRETFGDVRVYDNLEDAMADEQVHAAIVATPATSHFDVTRRVLEAGRHALVEKPLTTQAHEATELIRLAQQHRLALGVGHTFLHNEAVHTMKRYIDDGTIGDLHYLYAQRTNLGPIRSDVNALWDLAPHDISIFNYLLGDTPVEVSAIGANPLHNGGPDVGFINLRYGSGVVANIHVSWVDPFKVRQLVVVGSQQRIVFDDLNAAEPIRVYEKGVTSLSTGADPDEASSYLIRDGDIVSPKITAAEPLKAQVRNFFESIALERSAVEDSAMGLSVVEVMRAVDESVAMGGVPVAVSSQPVSTNVDEFGLTA